MKLESVVQALPAMQRLANESLTPKTLYWVSKLLNHMEKELEFFNAERNKLFQKYGEESEAEEGKLKIKKENTEAFESAMKAVLAVEIDNDFKAVHIPTTEKITLSYNDLHLLNGFIELEFIEE